MKNILIFAALFLFTLSIQAETLIIEPEMGRAPLLSAIQQAKSSIDVVMYGFTDQTFMDALIQAGNKHKNIHVLLEQSPYKNENENTLAAQTLRTGHVNFNWANPAYQLTHQKTIAIDRHTAIIMTFNLTHSSFNKERNFALVVDDPSEVNEIENVFNADLNRQHTSLKNTHLVWSPDNSREKLIDLIRQAHREIQIYAQSITDYKIIGELARKAKSGVRVEIITSAMPNDKNRKKYAYLTHSGVILHFNTQYYIHAKVIIVDHRIAMLGSMNLTKPSIDSNRELSVMTENKDVIKSLEKTFETDKQGNSFDHTLPKLPHMSYSMLSKIAKCVRHIIHLLS